MFHLIVTEPFGSYEKGQVITDQQAIAKIKNDYGSHHYVQINAPAPAAVQPSA